MRHVKKRKDIYLHRLALSEEVRQKRKYRGSDDKSPSVIPDTRTRRSRRRKY